MKTSILTLAIALAFSFTAAPADAKLTEGQKCAMEANLLSGKFSLCLNEADANVSKDKADDTAAADAKCETKFRSGWDKTRDKAKDKDASLGADCGGAMSDAVRDSVEASALIAAGTGRDLAAFAVSEDDLDDDSGIKSLVFDLTYVWTLDAYGDGCEAAGGSWNSGTCTADPTSDNQSVCEAANGTWDGSVCTPAAVPDRDCFREGACGVDGWGYASYAGVTVSSTGCSDTIAGTDSYNDGISSSIQFGCATPTTICATPQSIDSYKSIVCG